MQLDSQQDTLDGGRYTGLITRKSSQDAHQDAGLTPSPAEASANPISPGPATVDLCNGEQLLRALQAASAWLENRVPSINALNVFPVPDGDTGTNMSLTMRAAISEANGSTYESVSELARVVSHGALMGARGNSGVILSQILRGFARALDGKATFSAQDLAEALRESAATAYKGVMKPVEGTILTVVREAAQAAEDAAARGASVHDVIAAAHQEARQSVARTPRLLPVLAEAGVVDAGGQGFTVLLEGVLRYLEGQQEEMLATVSTEMVHAEALAGGYNYDTQFIIKGSGLDVETVRAHISTMGDSVLVVGDQETIKVHVHSDHPGEVLDYGISQGQITAVIIENMQLQYEQFVASQAEAQSPLVGAAAPDWMSASAPGDIAVVAVVSGDGLRRVFESLGVSAVVAGGQTMNPSTQDLLTAINAVPKDRVIVLPNNSNIILTAQQAQALASKQVSVVPTKTVPQGIAALLAFNYQTDLEANVAAMLEASTQVQTGEVTCAVRSVQVNGMWIDEGQYIGLLNDKLVTSGEDLPQVTNALLEQMDAASYEIITIYYGQDTTADAAESLAENVRTQYPNAEVEVLDGGQPHYYYIISAE